MKVFRIVLIKRLWTRKRSTYITGVPSRRIRDDPAVNISIATLELIFFPFVASSAVIKLARPVMQLQFTANRPIIPGLISFVLLVLVLFSSYNHSTTSATILSGPQGLELCIIHAIISCLLRLKKKEDSYE